MDDRLKDSAGVVCDGVLEIFLSTLSRHESMFDCTMCETCGSEFCIRIRCTVYSFADISMYLAQEDTYSPFNIWNESV